MTNTEIAMGEQAQAEVLAARMQLLLMSHGLYLHRWELLGPVTPDHQSVFRGMVRFPCRDPMFFGCKEWQLPGMAEHIVRMVLERAKQQHMRANH